MDTNRLKGALENKIFLACQELIREFEADNDLVVDDILFEFVEDDDDGKYCLVNVEASVERSRNGLE